MSQPNTQQNMNDSRERASIRHEINPRGEGLAQALDQNSRWNDQHVRHGFTLDVNRQPCRWSGTYGSRK